MIIKGIVAHEGRREAVCPRRKSQFDCWLGCLVYLPHVEQGGKVTRTSALLVVIEIFKKKKINE